MGCINILLYWNTRINTSVSKNLFRKTMNITLQTRGPINRLPDSIIHIYTILKFYEHLNTLKMF